MSGKPRHGFASRKSKVSPLYTAWRGMRQRCLNTKNPGYPYYGGRGISICIQWNKFEQFAADMGPPPMGYSLDRRDTNGNYEPSNCRWASKSTQMFNRRPYKIQRSQGVRNHNSALTISEVEEIRAIKGNYLHREIAQRYGVSRATISRILRGASYAEGAL